MPLKNISRRDFLQGSEMWLIAGVEIAQATGATAMQNVLTQIPYALIAAGITVAGYLILVVL